MIHKSWCIRGVCKIFNSNICVVQIFVGINTKLQLSRKNEFSNPIYYNNFLLEDVEKLVFISS